jgi:geranylgeranyl diphosphate synthase, type II
MAAVLNVQTPGVALAEPAEPSRFFAESLASYRDSVIAEMDRIIATKKFQRNLATRIAEYPLRAGKGLRPALCLATCQALGGKASDALPSAVALELYHNAFLVHDDIEDESGYRRGKPTIHQQYGLAIAINIGDALSVLAMTPLLSNLTVIGLGRTLRVFSEIERMARESVEGQAMELDWVSTREWKLTDRDYYAMTRKKTCWYTCVSPCRIGAIIAGARPPTLSAWRRFGVCLGIAFQIRDDLLNLSGAEDAYGKETAGDIWEGKRTLMLIALMQRASRRERERLVRIMGMRRQDKREEDVRWVLEMMHRHDCLDYGRDAAHRFATRANELFAEAAGHVPESPHKRFLEATIGYVIERER